jgi:hypothetical protein
MSRRITVQPRKCALQCTSTFLKYALLHCAESAVSNACRVVPVSTLYRGAFPAPMGPKLPGRRGSSTIHVKQHIQRENSRRQRYRQYGSCQVDPREGGDSWRIHGGRSDVAVSCRMGTADRASLSSSMFQKSSGLMATGVLNERSQVETLKP